ncbi:hypothetical protein BN2476_960069 [Paraburkholderia piptadeniae]|uniref:Uncharacterized protein n=1 Tax=Paraburkholderia piptadeniae TaxID=1701573 RepID=A0A1N7SUC4_9BURK|nr:hypothetical protein BN2476_960069 [Paraburkholderia piptadeniae]
MEPSRVSTGSTRRTRSGDERRVPLSALDTQLKSAEACPLRSNTGVPHRRSSVTSNIGALHVRLEVAAHIGVSLECWPASDQAIRLRGLIKVLWRTRNFRPASQDFYVLVSIVGTERPKGYAECFNRPAVIEMAIHLR